MPASFQNLVILAPLVRDYILLNRRQQQILESLYGGGNPQWQRPYAAALSKSPCYRNSIKLTSLTSG